MTPSDKLKDQGEKAAADYDAHLTKAEDHLEAVRSESRDLLQGAHRGARGASRAGGGL